MDVKASIMTVAVALVVQASARAAFALPGAFASPAAFAVPAVFAAPAAFAVPGVIASPAKPDIDLKVQVSTSRPTIRAGSDGEAILTLTPPPGIHVNRYPPIRLTVEPSPPITFRESTVKVGLDAMPDDPEKNPFETIDPIHLKFHVGEHASEGKIPIKGKLRFVYCVARSGYCANGAKDISFTVPVSAAR